MVKGIDQLSLEVINTSSRITHKYIRTLAEHWDDIVGVSLASHSIPYKIVPQALLKQSTTKTYCLILKTQSMYSPFFYFDTIPILNNANHFIGATVLKSLKTIV